MQLMPARVSLAPSSFLKTRSVTHSSPVARRALELPDSTVAESHSASNENALSEELEFVDPSELQNSFVTNWKLFWALPTRRFKSGSVLTIKLSGAISEQSQGRFSNIVSLPELQMALVKAALDPRIKGVCVKIDPLQCGWSKLQEIRRHVAYFKKSGKYSIAYLERAGEKEMYLASAFGEVYAPPSASVSLRGISVKGTFLRGTLDKIGIEPEVRRIGNYKSAGDQLLREEMSPYQREQLSALLDDIYLEFVEGLADARGKTVEEVKALIDEGIYDMARLKEVGMVDDLKYEDEINDMLKERTDGKDDELRFVKYKRYRKVNPKAFGIGGKKTIAVVRTSGAIVGGESQNNVITSDKVIAQLRALKKNKKVSAVVLRVDSPGGDALASDLMWREIQMFSKEKPIIASMSDVAASGGYYMSMACSKIVAEPLTITGSIGVVTGKFCTAELAKKIGYASETISKGKYAEILNDARPFNEIEAELFDKAAQHAYESFRDKAALSRNMEIDQMQAVAQGRVWTGKAAASIGLVDAIGGLNRAIQLAKNAAEIPEEEPVTIREVSRSSTSPLKLLTGGANAQALLALAAVSSSSSSASQMIPRLVGLQALSETFLSENDANLVYGMRTGSVMAQLPDFEVGGSSAVSSSDTNNTCGGLLAHRDDFSGIF
jgi:protease-4